MSTAADAPTVTAVSAAHRDPAGEEFGVDGAVHRVEEDRRIVEHEGLPGGVSLEAIPASGR